MIMKYFPKIIYIFITGALGISAFIVIISLSASSIIRQTENKHPASQTMEIKSAQKEDSSKPNIIMIQIDSLRADHLGSYGYEKNTTPFLDSLADKGIIFENMIAVAPFTCQTDASVLTGVYPSENNMLDWNRTINDKYKLIPKILSYYGYASIARVSPGLWDYLGISKSFDSYSTSFFFKNIEYVKDYLSKSLIETKTPFFAFWHIYDVHLPYMEASKDFYPGDYKGSLLPISTYFSVGDTLKYGDMTGACLIPWTVQIQNTVGADCSYQNYIREQKTACKKSIKLNDEDKKYTIASYDTGVNYTDQQLKDFFDFIKEQPFFDNTIFIIGGDHGEDHGEHGTFFHGDIYNTNIHVPFILYYNKLKPKKIKEYVSQIDIMPTILSLLGINPPQNIEGKDLTALINGGEYNKERPIFSERAPFDEFSVIKDGWKYILRDPSKKKEKNTTSPTTDLMNWVLNSDVDNFDDELFNLSNDQFEKNNLIGIGYEQEKELKGLVLDFKAKMLSARLSNETNFSGQPTQQKILPYP
jgi:arylsulfatase A-like enzyme